MKIKLRAGAPPEAAQEKVEDEPKSMKIRLRLRAAEDEPKPKILPPSKRMKIVIKKSGLRMVSSSFYIAKGLKLKPLGEDAHFICDDKQTIGVADGVSGWSKQGIDSGDFARALMRHSDAAVRSCSSESSSAVDPKRVLREAFSKMAGIQGASTACIVSHSDGVLRCANVGDSGFMVFRDGKLLHRSASQQRRFNCPFQLGNHESCDRPECAAESELAVAAEDFIVLGTDGLLDNMYASDISAIIGECEKDGRNLEELAWRIAEEAYYKSLDKLFLSPFLRDCLDAGKNKKHRGGKMDDITVVVGKIVPHYDLQLHTSSTSSSLC